MTHKMENSDIKEALASLNATLSVPWAYRNGSLRKSFEFSDFTQAFAFMRRAVNAIHALDHHPDWRNSFNRVEVVLTTHDLGGVSAKDFALAAEMELAARSE